jgi:hypothetical protein
MKRGGERAEGMDNGRRVHGGTTGFPDGKNGPVFDRQAVGSLFVQRVNIPCAEKSRDGEKPLESIHAKTPIDAPAELQCDMNCDCFQAVSTKF